MADFPYILKIWAEINKPLVAFLNLGKASDTAHHDYLLLELERYGIRSVAILLMKSYLSDQKQYVNFESDQTS